MRKPSEYFSHIFRDEILPAYIATRRNKRSAEEYFSAACLICDYLHKDFLLIDACDVKNYVEHLYSLCRQKRFSIKTLKNRLSYLRHIGGFISENFPDISYANPFLNDYIQVSHDIPLKRIPTMEEVDLLLSAAKEDSMYFLILLLASRAAMPVSKILQIRAHNIKFTPDSAIIYFPATASRPSDEMVLPRDVSCYLYDYIQKNVTAGDKYLFYNKHHNPLTNKNIDSAFEKILAESGVTEKYTIKDLRARAIVDMMQSNVPISDVAAYTGVTTFHIRAYTNAAKFRSQCPADLTNFSVKLPEETNRGGY